MQFESPTADDKFTFRLSGTHVAYANTLRRLMMTGVETVAFRADMTDKGTTTDVVVAVNDTAMTNEMLAHRICLLPLYIKNPLKWDKEKITFSLKVQADKDAAKDITCSDFVITEDVGEAKEPVIIPPETYFPPHPITRQTSLIATLPPGSMKIELTAKASVGTGREHSRFQPTSQCSYVYTLEKDDEERLEAHFQKWLLTMKRQDFEEIKDSPEEETYRREYATMERHRVYKIDEAGEPYSFDFTVESVGPLDVRSIVLRACEVGEAMMGKYVTIDVAGAPLPEGMAVVPSNSRLIGFDFLMKGHDHTFGNMIQTYLSMNHMSVPKGSDKVPITYAGYEIPHPLRDELVVRIGMNSKNELDARKAFAQACQGCVRIFQEMKRAYGGEAVAVEEGLKAAIAAAPKAKAVAKPAASSKAVEKGLKAAVAKAVAKSTTPIEGSTKAV
jgi:DNA-directed RNA polymerase alpha subunit/DNA-directed RNA polymerase subunit L